jgi:ribosomal protein L37AE/L43A
LRSGGKVRSRRRFIELKLEASMYCPSCGAEYLLELNYCNRCGANLTAPVALEPQLAPISVTKPSLIIGSLMTLITLGGFVILMAGAVTLAQVFRQSDPIIAIIVFGMITILVSDIILARLLSRIIRHSLEQRRVVEQLPKAPVREVKKQLNPKLEPVASVTEHTTRTFSPAFRESVERGTK